ncbi:MAG: cytochrome c biogenesis protein CcsA [Archaeoglobaceae archaeon]
MLRFLLLLFSLISAISSAIFFMVSIKVKLRFAEVAETLLYLSLSFTTASILLLLHYLITDDFSIAYVYFNSEREMGFEYKISALWAGKEGTLLLWNFFNLFIVSFFTNTGKKDAKKAKALGIMMVCSSALLLLNLLYNPFNSLPFKHLNGLGMNPLLRTPEMIFHPPLVFLSYSLVICAYACRLAGVEERNIVKIAWFFSTAGIVLGGLWAYRTLGWGGFWGWDPVENSSLLLWLSLTAYFHLKKGRDLFIYLAMIFVFFTAFITRSGILSSVHSFGEDPAGFAYLLFALTSAFPLIRKWRIEDRCYTSLLFAAMILLVSLGTVANLFKNIDRTYYLLTFSPLFLITVFAILYRLRKSRKKILHLGVILLFIGANSVWFFEQKEVLELNPFGEADGIKFHLKDFIVHQDEEKTILKAKITSDIGIIEPELLIYPRTSIPRVYVINTPLMDYYFAIRDVGENYVKLEFYKVPLISFVWLGSILILIGLVSQKLNLIKFLRSP